VSSTFHPCVCASLSATSRTNTTLSGSLPFSKDGSAVRIENVAAAPVTVFLARKYSVVPE
jgi:hypothetical protein